MRKPFLSILVMLFLASSFGVAHSASSIRTYPVQANSIGPVLPNSSATPGATNSAVTQANIQSTICISGYTKTIRPPASYTTALKIRQLSTLPYSAFNDLNTRDFEEDHLISLELGGNPTDPKNLWPEPYASTTGARVKDRLENALHVLVCNGSLTLKTAQWALMA